MGRESLQTMILGRKQDWEQSPAKSWPSQLEAPEERVPVREVPHGAEMAGPWYSDLAPSLAEGCLGRAGIVASARKLGEAWRRSHLETDS